MPRNALAQALQLKVRQAGNFVVLATHAEFRVHLLCHALREIRSSNVVDGNHNHAAQHAAEESSHPLGAVFSPEQHLVGAADAAGVQFARKPVGAGQNVAVAPVLYPVSTTIDVGRLSGVPAEVVQVFQYGGARHSTAVYRVMPRRRQMASGYDLRRASGRIMPSGGSHASALSAYS